MGEDTTNEGGIGAEERTKLLREDLKAIGHRALVLKSVLLSQGFADTKAQGNKELESEAIANATLAFRHIEDAAMRLGKVLQALNGGESIYDNSGVVGQKVG